MTGLNVKRKATESPTTELPAQSEPAAVPPARRRTNATKDDLTIGYHLRSRNVMVPLPREEREPTPSRQTLTCAELAVEHYNSMNQGDEHELVEGVASSAFTFNGIWVHVNFLAKQKGAASCVGLSPSFFVAEVKGDNKGFSCVSCVKIDSGNPRDLGGCRMCPHRILHPAAGGYRTAQPIQKVAARKKCVIIF